MAYIIRYCPQQMLYGIFGPSEGAVMHFYTRESLFEFIELNFLPWSFIELIFTYPT